VAFKDLRITSEEKDASILELKQEVETARTDLEKEKKQVEGKLPLELFTYRLADFTKIRSRLIFFSLSGLQTALGTSTTQAEVLLVDYNSSQQELGLLEQAALGVCQSIDEGAGQAGSSVESRLRALGGHVAGRMRGALRLGIQKALSVVQLHYLVNLAALATGYIVADDLDDDGAQAVVDHLDALAAPAATILADDFEEDLFPNAPPAGPLER
jgi:hypothetical protein